MAIVISGNGYLYTVQSTMGLQTFESPSELNGVNIPGRNGIVIHKKVVRLAPQTIVLSGLLTGIDANDLASNFNDLSELVNSSPEPLIINTGSRTIRVRKTNVAVERIPSGNKKLRIAITFISEDGFWQETIPVATSLGSFSGYPKAVLKSVTVSGSYKTYPTLLWKPSATIQDPTVTWYGRNLIKNSQFDDRATDWMLTGYARWERYANKRVARVGLGETFRQDNIPCNASTAYYFSAYAASDTAAIARLTIRWYDSADLLLGTDLINYVTTATLTRFSGTITTLATASYFQIHLGSTVSSVFVYITDIQVEESASLSEYMPSQDVRFAITDNTTFINNDVLEVDCENKTVRWWDSGPPAWYNKIDVSNAQFFYLIPGKNLLVFTGENANNAQVVIRYIDKYLGY